MQTGSKLGSLGKGGTNVRDKPDVFEGSTDHSMLNHDTKMMFSSKESKQISGGLIVASVGALLAVAASLWLAKINTIVPDPYLV